MQTKFVGFALICSSRVGSCEVISWLRFFPHFFAVDFSRRSLSKAFLVNLGNERFYATHVE